MALGIEPAKPGEDSLLGCDIGGVTIIRLIAEGGMGRVYEGKQEKPNRTVAVKVMRPGLTSPSILKRFEYEAEVLGRLQHPGIAHIYSVGVHRVGNATVPYFVMEYIADARSLTQYAEGQNLTIDQRIGLLREVCDAVAHGHQKGIIHRDLKPSNLLVDGSGRIKVIDFGIARAAEADATAATMITDIGQLVGTLPYMSPEQFASDPSLIDNRTDVYALGVVLYQLVAGRPPFECRGRPVYQVAQTISDDEPPTLRSLVPKVPRDLGVIAAKCLSKERAVRYGDARELRDELQRFLNGEPIQAVPPSALVSLRRFARRHRAVTVAAAAAMLAFVAAFIGISIFALELRQQQLKTERILALLINMLPSSRPGAVGEGRNESIRPADLLARYREEVASEKDPAARATLFHAIGESFLALGESRLASLAARDAHALWQSVKGPRADATLTSLALLATSLLSGDEVDDAVRLTESLRDLCKERYGSGSPRLVEAIGLHARALRREGNLPEALLAATAAVEEAKEATFVDHRSRLLAINNLGVIYGQVGQLDAAVKYHEQAYVGGQRQLGKRDRDLVQYSHNLGVALIRRASLHAAEGNDSAAQADTRRGEMLLEEVCGIRQADNGTDHPDTVDALYDLCSSLWQRRARDQVVAILSPAREPLERWSARAHRKAIAAIKILDDALAIPAGGAPGEMSTRQGVLREGS
jgi:tRNA A-37 threonylcarbamoyl transferase component Bud32/tetratricopeptide (TPR) repeat protein